VTDQSADNVIRDQLERGALGALLTTTDPDRADALIDTLGDPSGFTNPAAAHAWTVAADTWVRTGTCDTLGVATALRGARPTVDPLWLLGCASIDHLPVTHEQALQWATQIRQRGRHRDLLSQLTRAVQIATTDPERLPAVLDRVQELARPAGRELSTEVNGWDRIDLTAVLAGDVEPELPTLMERVDGHALLYPGRVHDFHGEPESGKSFAAQIMAARCLIDNQDVLYLDYETDERLVTGRMLELGVEPAQILAHLDYRRPDRAATVAEAGYVQLLKATYTLAVVDGVTDSVGHQSLRGSSDSTDDIAAWRRAVPDPIARKTGAAVIQIDHVTKNAETRGRFAIGSQAKLAGISGCSYLFEVISELGRGLKGEVSIRVAKDRPGGVRPHSGSPRAGDRTQETARLVVDSTTPGVIVAILNGPDEQPIVEGARRFVPTFLMQRIAAFVLGNPGALKKEIEECVKGNTDGKREALATLVAAGYVEARKEGPGNGLKHHNVVVYTDGMDPLRAP